eukprot:s718_g14.t1
MLTPAPPRSDQDTARQHQQFLPRRCIVVMDDGREGPRQSLIPEVAGSMRDMPQGGGSPLLDVTEAGQSRGSRPPRCMVGHCCTESWAAGGVHTVPHGNAEPTNKASRAALCLEPVVRDVALEGSREMGVNVALHADVVGPTAGAASVATGAPRDWTVHTGKLTGWLSAIVDFHGRWPRVSSFPNAMPTQRPARPTRTPGVEVATRFCQCRRGGGRKPTKGLQGAGSDCWHHRAVREMVKARQCFRPVRSSQGRPWQREVGSCERLSGHPQAGTPDSPSTARNTAE